MNYSQSGVNIQAGNQAVSKIKDLVASTFSKHVLGGLGGFAAFYEMPTGYKQPVMVSCTDGVGTKILLATKHDQLEGLGQDLVAMSVNDLLCTGAKPLFFLDYIGCHELNPDQMKRLVSGIVDGCKLSNCSLVGGEMAEMRDVYKPGDVDMVGFVVGVVEKSEILDGSQITADQFVYQLPSSGPHSNGYSLIRQACTDEKIKQFNININDLLAPTKIYVNEIDTLRDNGVTISGLAHITGGGLVENLERVLPKNINVDIDQHKIEVPEIFRHIQKCGDITDAEMNKVFNMGVGMILISPDKLDYPLIGATSTGTGNVILS